MNIMQSLVTLGHVPGMPAAGHMSGGYWHPGGKSNCRKCAPRKPVARTRHQRETGS